MATILKYNNTIYKQNNKPVKINWNSGDGLYFGKTDNNDFVTCGLSTPNIRFSKSSTFSFAQSFLYRSHINTSGATFQNRVFGIIETVPFTGMYPLNAFSVASNQFISAINWYQSGIAGNTRFVIPTPVENTVCHLVMTHNGVDLQNEKCYFNGIEITNKTITNNNLVDVSPLASEPFRIGFSGSISSKCINYDLKIFDKELTDLEVKELYYKQNQIIPASAMSSLQADWRFNQRSGTTLKDYSPNGYNGTLTNFNNVTLGASNQWVYNNNNPITQY